MSAPILVRKSCHPHRQKARQAVPSIKQVLPAETQKEYGRFVRTPFHTPCMARYSVLHLLGILSGGRIAFSCGRRGTALAVDEELL